MLQKYSIHLQRIAVVIVVSLFFTGCSSNAAAPTTTPKDTINYQMGWVHEYSSAPFYMAIADGYYAAQDLDVKLSVGGFDDKGAIDPIDQVLSGAADFSEANVFSLLQARAEGKPVVAIATLNQRSPYALIYLADKGIVRPQDLVGKTVAVATGGATLEYQSLIRSQSIDPSKVNQVERISFGIDPLVKGEVDAFGGWIINEGVALQESGAKPSFFLLSDYGIDTYDLLIFTTEDMIAKNPDKVQRFLKGTLDGLKDTVANPEKAIDATLTYDKTLDHDGQLRRLQAFIPLIQPAGTQLGVMEPEIWQFNYQLMLDNGLLTQPQDVTKAYTMDFLNKIYGTQPVA
ncbi:MAG: ABC transporter substrate-binding protein [Chloroflexota bacterium]